MYLAAASMRTAADPLMALSPARMPSPKVVLHPSVPAAARVEDFWPRLRRATILLVCAIALHVFVVRAPHPGSTFSESGASTVLKSVAGSAAAAAPSADGVAADLPGALRTRTPHHVTIVTDSIRAVEIREDDVQRGRRHGTPTDTADALRADARPAPSRLRREMVSARAAQPATLTPYLTAADNPGETGSDRATPALALDIPLLSRPERTLAFGSAPPAPAPSAPATRAAGRPADTSHADTSAATASEDGNQTQRVLRVIQEYTRAFERLDIQATKAVYPSAPDRELRRAFRGLEGQRIRLDNCGVSISGSGQDANARCQGDYTYRPKVGSGLVRLNGREWIFSLSRNEGGWQILNATVQ